MKLPSFAAALMMAMTATPALAVYDVIVKPTVQNFNGLQTSSTGDADGGSFYYHPNWAGSNSPSAQVRYILPTLPPGERIYNIYGWHPTTNYSQNFSVLTARADGVNGAGFTSPFIHGWPGQFGQNGQWIKRPEGASGTGQWQLMGAGPQTDEWTDGGHAIFLNPANQIPGSGVFTEPELYIEYQNYYSLRLAFTSIRVIEVGVVGDFDGDGDADGNDLLEWQRGNGTHGVAVDPFEPLHPVDLLAVTKNFGTVGGPYLSATAVPEPGTIVLATLGMISVRLATRRRSA